MIELPLQLDISAGQSTPHHTSPMARYHIPLTRSLNRARPPNPQPTLPPSLIAQPSRFMGTKSPAQPAFAHPPSVRGVGSYSLPTNPTFPYPDAAVLCKFFAHGACLKGENCEYAHDWTAPPNNICTFYQKGACAYGARCRYDHVKPVKVSRSESPASSSSAASVVTTIDRSPIYRGHAELSPTSRLLPSRSKAAWIPQLEDPDTSDDDVFLAPRSHDLDDQVLCSFAAAGHCPRGDKCPHIHGDLCPTCGKYCLHPSRPKEREEHSKTCAKMQKHLEILRRSQEIECSVCLERVLLKPGVKDQDRKFGILSECDHPFCVKCIRLWRRSSPSSGMDINSTLRACPICRKLSYFIIPSVIWYFSQEEKDEIVNNYKGKLKSIDCKYFDFGNGSCPFGTSCFYKHSYPDGTLEEVALRHLADADGETVISKEIRVPPQFPYKLNLRWRRPSKSVAIYVTLHESLVRNEWRKTVSSRVGAITLYSISLGLRHGVTCLAYWTNTQQMLRMGNKTEALEQPTVVVRRQYHADV
ncbi:hypothetical protein KSS87_012291 [Heliosperma pusillum]|nr:hypothetical protein KSS87_012291 [Heliosperma pusillum]